MVVGKVEQPETPVTMFVNANGVGVRRSEMGDSKSVGLEKESYRRLCSIHTDSVHEVDAYC